MTYIVPNHLLEHMPDKVISADSIFTFAYTSSTKQKRIAVRNTTHVMILITSGSKTIHLENDEQSFKAGDIILLTQGNYFMSEIAGDKGIYEAVLIYFEDDFIMDFMKKHHIQPESKTSKDMIYFSSGSLLQPLISSYKLYIHQNLQQQNEIIKLKTQEIFLHLLTKDKPLFYKWLQAITRSSKHRILHILESNLDMITSVDDMCKIARISKYELRSSIKNASGLHPKAWLDTKRLEQAALLLKSSDESISSIATSCGYSTVSWFGVQFKKAYGISPKVYREQNR